MFAQPVRMVIDVMDHHHHRGDGAQPLNGRQHVGCRSVEAVRAFCVHEPAPDAKMQIFEELKFLLWLGATYRGRVN